MLAAPPHAVDAAAQTPEESGGRSVVGKPPVVACIPTREWREISPPHADARASYSPCANLSCTGRTHLPAQRVRRAPECIHSSVGLRRHRADGQGRGAWFLVMRSLRSTHGETDSSLLQGGVNPDPLRRSHEDSPNRTAPPHAVDAAGQTPEESGHPGARRVRCAGTDVRLVQL